MDYAYIRAWCQMIHANDDYLEDQLKRARMLRAPSNATYMNLADGRFHTTDDIIAQSTRAKLKAIRVSLSIESMQ